jgi:hypothetical protein
MLCYSLSNNLSGQVDNTSIGEIAMSDSQSLQQELVRVRTELANREIDLAQARRILNRWWIGGSVLLVLILISFLIDAFLGGGWFFLTIALCLTAVGTLIGFFSADNGSKTLAHSWELKNEIAKLQMKQQKLEEEQIENYDPLEYYSKVEVPQVVEEFQRGSRANRRIHLILQLVIIFCSLFVSGLTSGLDAKIGLHWVWLAPALSLIVTLCTTITGYFKFRERGFYLQQTADAIEQESTALRLSIGGYVPPMTDEERIANLVKFAEKIEALREEQRKRQQQLEQPSEIKEAQA